jgi:hypothetical protein
LNVILEALIIFLLTEIRVRLRVLLTTCCHGEEGKKDEGVAHETPQGTALAPSNEIGPP